MSDKKQTSAGEARRKLLMREQKNGYDLVKPEQLSGMEEYCAAYRGFLDQGKTEREAVEYVISLIEPLGFRPLRRGDSLKPGDKVYRINRGKAVMLAVMGEEPLSAGVNICAAHIDSPRLDLKPNPLYEDSDFALMKTHYYGGIRKYQWVSIPLELHGVVVKKDGTAVRINIGSQPGDPMVVIPDLLPHLADKQGKKPLATAIEGENLNLMVGSRPFPEDEGTDRVKLAVLDLLYEKYAITEEDFISAEISAVPAGCACDIGLDRSMVGGYGQDDRVCAFAALKAMLNAERFRRTGICILADKEEIGSEGVTGMQSQAFDTFVSDLCQGQQLPLKSCYERSFCLSADVTAAYDPNYADVYDKRNAGFINGGVGLCKYTGARGKSGASDAGAETVAYIRRLFDDAGVIWHMAELGKVDAGGGGTVACYMANRDIDTLDAGVPVLGMHAPFEVTGKLDCYMTYLGMKAVFEA